MYVCAYIHRYEYVYINTHTHTHTPLWNEELVPYNSDTKR